MTTRTLRMIYAPSLLREAVINQLIGDFSIPLNNRRAHIPLDIGCLDFEINDEMHAIETTAQWLIGEGIEAEEVG